MKRIVLPVLTLALCGSIHASVIIGNSVTGPFQVGTNQLTKSVGFQTGASALLLDDIQVVLGAPTSGGGTLTFTLNADSSGSPGAVIATIGTSPLIASFSAEAAYTITPVGPLALAANTTYWIQAAWGGATGPDRGRTNPQVQPSDGLAHFIGYNLNGGSSTTFNAIIVDGHAATTSTPEPSTILLAGAAFTVLLIRLQKFA